MKHFRRLKLIVFFIAVFALALGFSVMTAPKTVDAAKLCCYMYCTVDPPIVCWEMCKPCPKFP